MAPQLSLFAMPFGKAMERVLAGSITESVSVAAILKVEVPRRQGASYS